MVQKEVIIYRQGDNFTDLSKLAFKDLPIKTKILTSSLQYDDLAILREVKKKKNPSKKELIALLVNEKSTLFEIIKRLVRNGLLEEEIDNLDRRIRRVSLTSKGKSILELGEIQTSKMIAKYTVFTLVVSFK